MKTIRSWLLGMSMMAALAGATLAAPATAQAAQSSLVAKQGAPVSVVANALIQFETATRWEAMAPTWRGRRNDWIARVRAAQSPQQLGALTVELETIMTWAAMYPAWRQERAPWLARTGGATSVHDIAQSLIALETATTWTAMYEERWRPLRAGWIAQLQSM